MAERIDWHWDSGWEAISSLEIGTAGTGSNPVPAALELIAVNYSWQPQNDFGKDHNQGQSDGL
jgi:hypothetical protein